MISIAYFQLNEWRMETQIASNACSNNLKFVRSTVSCVVHSIHSLDACAIRKCSAMSIRLMHSNFAIRGTGWHDLLSILEFNSRFQCTENVLRHPKKKHVNPILINIVDLNNIKKEEEA